MATPPPDDDGIEELSPEMVRKLPEVQYTPTLSNVDMSTPLNAEKAQSLLEKLSAEAATMSEQIERLKRKPSFERLKKREPAKVEDLLAASKAAKEACASVYGAACAAGASLSLVSPQTEHTPTADESSSSSEDPQTQFAKAMRLALLSNLLPVCETLDITSVKELREYEYDELHKILAQDELSNLFDKGNLGYAKWDGNTGPTPSR